MKKKIIFDLDNTLLFIGSEWIKSYQKYIDDFNLKISFLDLYNCIDNFEKENQDNVVDVKMCISYINEHLKTNIKEEEFMYLLDLYKETPLLYVDVIEEVLKYLSKKYTLYAYSDWFTQNQIDRLKKYHLDGYFEKVYGWDIIPTKPSKDAINMIIGSNNKEDYIFIGDNINVDLVVPDEMGIDVIFLNNKNIKQDKYKEIKNILELKDIL